MGGCLVEMESVPWGYERILLALEEIQAKGSYTGLLSETLSAVRSLPGPEFDLLLTAIDCLSACGGVV